jgi:hypothetical protein
MLLEKKKFIDIQGGNLKEPNVVRDLSSELVV